MAILGIVERGVECELQEMAELERQAHSKGQQYTPTGAGCVAAAIQGAVEGKGEGEKEEARMGVWVSDCACECVSD